MALYSCAILSSCLVFFWIFLNGAETLKINVVSPGIFGFDAIPSLGYNGPAIETGVQHLQSTYPQHTWISKYIYDDNITNCVDFLENVQFLLSRWYYQQRDERSLSLMITSGCIEGIYLSQLAAAWDILLITSSVSDRHIQDRQRNPTWVTTTPFPPLDDVYCSFLDVFNWTEVYVVLDETDSSSGYYDYVSRRVKAKLKDCGVQFTSRTFASDDKLTSTLPILQEFNSKSRVFLYFGQSLGLRKILIDAVQLNMTNGEHLYLAVIPWASQSYGNFTWQMFDNDDEVVREAYKSVILITLIDEATFTSRSVQNLTAKWKFLSENVYNNTALKFELPLPNLVATQTAIEISGMVVNEVLQQTGAESKHLLASGKVFAEMILNRTFDLEIGRMHMTSFGHGDFLVHASYFDVKTGIFKIFLQASLDANDHFVWTKVTEGRWFGGTVFPSNKPRCGFDGKQNICLKYVTFSKLEYWTLGTLLIAASILFIIAAVAWHRHVTAEACLIDWWLLRDFAVTNQRTHLSRLGTLFFESRTRLLSRK